MADTSLWFPPEDPNDVDVDKNVDINFDFNANIDFNVDVDVDKDKDVDINIDQNVNIEDNVAEANVSVEAIGDDTLAELDLIVLTTDDLSSVEAVAIAATGSGSGG